MTHAYQNSKLKPFVVKELTGRTGKRQLGVLFRGFGAIREVIPEGRLGEMAVNSSSDFAVKFGTTVVCNFDKGAAEIDCDICLLQLSALEKVPVKGMDFLFALGLKRDDGKITPLAVSHKEIVVPDGSEAKSFSYDEKTNFGELFQNMLTPHSFI